MIPEDELPFETNLPVGPNPWVGILAGNPQKWPDQMGQTVYPRPTNDELRDLLAALLWTEGLQSDVGDFIRNYPHLDPRKDPET